MAVISKSYGEFLLPHYLLDHISSQHETVILQLAEYEQL